MKNRIKNNNEETVLKIEYQNRNNLGVSIDHKISHSYDFNHTEANFH